MSQTDGRTTSGVMALGTDRAFFNAAFFIEGSKVTVVPLTKESTDEIMRWSGADTSDQWLHGVIANTGEIVVMRRQGLASKVSLEKVKSQSFTTPILITAGKHDQEPFACDTIRFTGGIMDCLYSPTHALYPYGSENYGGREEDVLFSDEMAFKREYKCKLMGFDTTIVLSVDFDHEKLGHHRSDELPDLRSGIHSYLELSFDKMLGAEDIYRICGRIKDFLSFCCGERPAGGRISLFTQDKAEKRVSRFEDWIDTDESLLYGGTKALDLGRVGYALPQMLENFIFYVLEYEPLLPLPPHDHKGELRVSSYELERTLRRLVKIYRATQYHDQGAESEPGGLSEELKEKLQPVIQRWLRSLEQDELAEGRKLAHELKSWLNSQLKKEPTEYADMVAGLVKSYGRRLDKIFESEEQSLGLSGRRYCQSDSLTKAIDAVLSCRREVMLKGQKILIGQMSDALVGLKKLLATAVLTQAGCNAEQCLKILSASEHGLDAVAPLSIDETKN